MVLTKATNGKTGYCYWKDLDAVYSRDLTVTVQELNYTAPVKERRIAEKFCDLTNDLYGVELITIEEATEALSIMWRPGGTDAAQKALATDIAERVLANEDIHGKEIVSSDGRMDQNHVGSEPATALCILAERTGIEGVTKANDLLDFNTFNALYNEARQSVGIPIPVYESDGRTQIGVYMCDSL